jgi:hypothetical protein
METVFDEKAIGQNLNVALAAAGRGMGPIRVVMRVGRSEPHTIHCDAERVVATAACRPEKVVRDDGGGSIVEASLGSNGTAGFHCAVGVGDRDPIVLAASRQWEDRHDGQEDGS